VEDLLDTPQAARFRYTPTTVTNTWMNTEMVCGIPPLTTTTMTTPLIRRSAFNVEFDQNLRIMIIVQDRAAERLVQVYHQPLGNLPPKTHPPLSNPRPQAFTLGDLHKYHARSRTVVGQKMNQEADTARRTIESKACYPGSILHVWCAKSFPALMQRDSSALENAVSRR